MRVLVDGWELLPGARLRGAGRFLEGLLPALADRSGIEVAVLRHRSEADDVPEGATAVPVSRSVPRERTRTGSVEHVLRLPLDLRRVPHDVFLAPAGPPPLHTPRPWVHVVHDLAPLVLDHPQYRVGRVQWQLLGRRLRRAERVVAVSRFSADEATRVLDLDPARVEVVHHGVDPRFRPADSEDTAEPDGAPYVVTVGAADPRKGFREAAAVGARLRDRGVEATVRIAGDLPDDLRRSLEGVGAGGVRCLGYVDDLPWLLRHAAVAIVTSRYEGFGFLALEAMASGTPVVAFDNTAIPEVVGDAGILVRDGDVAAMATQVARLLQDDHARRDLRTAGLERAATFRWEDAADRYAETLRSSATSRSPRASQP